MLPDAILDTENLPSSDILNLAEQLVDSGYKRLWVTEGIGADAFSVASGIFAKLRPKISDDVEIGTNTVSVFTRTPLAIAMAAITVDDIANHKFFLTLGTGGIGFIERCHGIKFEHPSNRLREYLKQIRVLTKTKAGERVTYKDEIFQTDFRMRNGLGNNLTIYVSAINKRNLQLAGEYADGVVLTHMPIGYVEEVKKYLAIGAAKSKRDPSKIKIFFNAPVGLDEPKSIEILRKVIAFHISAPTFERMLTSCGLGTEYKTISNLWNERNIDKAVKATTDDVLLEVGLGFRPNEIRERIAQYQNVGVQPILFPSMRPGKAIQDFMNIARICSSP